MNHNNSLGGAIYLRRAAKTQTDDFELDALGELLLREYAARDGIEIVKVYEDNGVSGLSKPNLRPGLSELLRDAREGKFNVLYVSGLDRFGRNVQFVLDVVNQLQAAGVTIKTGGREILTTDPIET